MISHSPFPLAEVPSRYANPFATCWTRPGALPFHFPNGESAEKLVAELAARRWRGAIVGPHGSGKSTLLETLKPNIIAAGRHVTSIPLHDGQRRLPEGWRHEIAAKSKNPVVPTWADNEPNNRLLVVDGYEQLAWPERVRLRMDCRRRGIGLLVATHTPVWLPTLIRLAPDLQLVERLVAQLSAQVSTDITPADVAASHACHGSNVREILFDLYDRHELRRRESNSLPAAS